MNDVPIGKLPFKLYHRFFLLRARKEIVKEMRKNQTVPRK